MSNGIKVKFCQPFVGELEALAASRTIQKGWLTTGKITEHFENKLADYTGAKHCVLLSSCTAALFLSLQWLKKKNPKMKKVLVPSLTFAATATEVINAGLKPVFGDVDDTMCLRNIGDRYVDAVIPVHLCGIKANTKYSVPVIEDSAHLIEKDQLKNNPNLVCYSFYATKNITMGEGGAICTNDDEAAAWFKQARHHGISKGGWDRYKQEGSWKYDIEFIGWKFNPSDILASVGAINLEVIDTINKERQRVVDYYNKELNYDRKGLHLYPILVRERANFIQFMADNGIQCSVHFLPLHKMTAFVDRTNRISRLFQKRSLTRTNYYGERLVSLPLFPELTNEQAQYICQKVKESKLLMPL